jgi:hypothetical protein
MSSLLNLIGSYVYLRAPVKIPHWKEVGDFMMNTGLEVGDRVFVTGIREIDGKTMLECSFVTQQGPFVTEHSKRMAQFTISPDNVIAVWVEERTQYRVKNGEWYDSEKDAVFNSSL